MRGFVAVLGLIGCAHATVQPTGNKQALMDADTVFAKDVGERGVEAWLDAFAADGVMMPNNNPVVPKAQIGELMQRLGDPRKEKPALRIDWTPKFAAISDDGTLGYTIGNSVAHTAEGDRQGKYVTIWRRQPDGSYKAVLDIGNQGWAFP